MSQKTPERINAAWNLVIEQGYARKEAAAKLGLSESRVDHIINALQARRERLAQPPAHTFSSRCEIFIDDDLLTAEMVEQLLSASLRVRSSGE